MLADRLGVAQVMVVFEQAVEQRLISGAPHRAELDGLEFGQAGLQWGGIHGHRGWLAARITTVGQRIGRNLADRGQLDVPGAMECQHQPPAHHVAQRPVGLPPVPGRAQ